MRSNLDIAKIMIIILGGYSFVWSITAPFLYILSIITSIECIFITLLGLVIGLWCIGFGASVPLKKFVQDEDNDTKKVVNKV